MARTKRVLNPFLDPSRFESGGLEEAVLVGVRQCREAGERWFSGSGMRYGCSSSMIARAASFTPLR